jgi:hypothetical protein
MLGAKAGLLGFHTLLLPISDTDNEREEWEDGNSLMEDVVVVCLGFLITLEGKRMKRRRKVIMMPVLCRKTHTNAV